MLRGSMQTKKHRNYFKVPVSYKSACKSECWN